MSTEVLIIVISLLLSGFFSGMEIAFVSANKIQLEIDKKREDWWAQILTKITLKPSGFITAMLVGNNLALVIYGYFMGDLLMGLFSQMQAIISNPFLYRLITEFGLLTQTVISTLVILLTAEFLPKVFFQIYANHLLKWLSPVAFFFLKLFWAPSAIIIGFTDWLLRKFFKTEGDAIQQTFTKMELGHYINEQMENTENEEVDTEVQIFQNALEFSNIKTREIMVPRTEIEAVEINTDLQEIKKIFTETGFSKLLVYKENIDDIVGYVHAFDFFKKPKKIKRHFKTRRICPRDDALQRPARFIDKEKEEFSRGFRRIWRHFRLDYDRRYC